MRADVRDPQGDRGSPRRPGRVVIIGDSHIHAIKEALEERGPEKPAVPMSAMRLLKVKAVSRAGDDTAIKPRLLDRARALFAVGDPDSIQFGDISMLQALKLARSLRPEDVLVSVIGGNQHAVFSTIQHPQPFDFMLEGDAENPTGQGGELVPFRALYPYFLTALRDGDGETISAFRHSTRARMIHLLAPPPKRMNEWIEQHHDTMFAAEGLAHQGVSRPELRLKFWRLQNRAVEEICAELGVEVLGNPAGAFDEHGYLDRLYYAGDATHANPRYGELVLQQLEALLQREVASA